MQKIQGSINYTQENNNRKGSDIKFNWQRLQSNFTDFEQLQRCSQN